MSLKDISAYWNHWISKDKEGDPFSFLDDSSVKGESDDASDKSDDDGVGEGGADKPSVIPPDHFSIDHKIPSPILCDTPNSRTNCLQKLVSKGDQTSKTFHTLVKLVDAFGVSFIIRHTISIISYIFQDTDVPSIYQNSRWPYIHWSWEDIHLPADAHEDRETIDSFLRWLTLKASGLSNQIPLNKNQLQELLLGVALFLRDLEFACFTNTEETSIPPYLVNSCMEATDVDSIGRVVDIIFKAVQDQLE